ncbi:MAG: hypothetical protein Q8868_06030 [Bacteroidota bacterium]|nr:hypothetical protein [Bacteroidota bacterium]
MASKENIIAQETIEKATGKTALVAEDLLWLGFIIYIASFVIASTDSVNYVVCNIFQILGIALMLPSAVILFNTKIENGYLRIVFFIYILWLLAAVIRGIKFDYEFLKLLLFDPNKGIFLYLVPLFILIPLTPTFLKKLFNTIVILGIIYLLYDLLFIKQLLYSGENLHSQGLSEYFIQQLSLPCGFILLTFIYHTRKINLFALLIMGVSFLIAVIRARRGLIFISFSMLTFAWLIYQMTNKTRVINIVLSLFFITIIAYAAIGIYNQNRKETFSLITERISQRTRSQVEQYFYRDMKTTDWIIGKGLAGEYFCPGVNEGEGKITVYRTVIETGFLQIILNGGIISLSLFILITLPAIIKGLFYSRNFLAKAAALWVVLLLLYLYPAAPVIFTLNYIIVWISIAICYSEEIRKLSNDEMLEILKAAKN